MPALPHPDPPLTDGVAVLRPLREADLPLLVAAVQDPAIVRFISSIPRPYGPQQAAAFLAEQARMTDEVFFVVADAGDPGRLLGGAGLHAVSWAHRRAETGYWLAPWARGRGLATRALRLVASWALGPVGLVRVGLVADVDNAASLRVAERAGFVREGVLRRHTVMGGASRDVAVYGCVAGQ